MHANDLFIKKIAISKEDFPSTLIYPFNIPIIKNFQDLTLSKNVTFLVGENGIGKSTFIEALAVACGLNAEGGTNNFMFTTRPTDYDLSNYIKIDHFQRRVETKFFLRAESFYNVATEIENLGVGGYGSKNLHQVSHGESFLQLVENRFTPNGLYILDEPEAALSPSRQMTLLYLINELAHQGSQFIIATHSPILISYRDGEILDLNNNFQKIQYEETEIYQTYKLYLEKPYEMQRRLFDE